jgi:thiol-disulfide isomerase/thioredoxin
MPIHDLPIPASEFTLHNLVVNLEEKETVKKVLLYFFASPTETAMSWCGDCISGMPYNPYL